jgi:hypothetical protein
MTGRENPKAVAMALTAEAAISVALQYNPIMGALTNAPAALATTEAGRLIGPFPYSSPAWGSTPDCGTIPKGSRLVGTESETFSAHAKTLTVTESVAWLA